MAQKFANGREENRQSSSLGSSNRYIANNNHDNDPHNHFTIGYKHPFVRHSK